MERGWRVLRKSVGEVYTKSIFMHRGFGLIEIIVGSAILATSLVGISAYYQSSLQVSRTTAQIVQASFLLEEGIEVARFFRDTGWANVGAPADGTVYYLAFNGTAFATSTTDTGFVDGVFERSITLNDVSRDLSDDIVAVGGTVDPNTRKVTVTVSFWDRTATTTRTVSTYLTNVF